MTAGHTNINSLKKGNIISGFYLVTNVKEKLTAYGFPYVTGTLTDLSGTLRFVMWNPCTITSQVEGKIIYAGGEINEYKDQLQAELYDARVPDDSEVSEADKGYIIPIAPIDIEKAYQEIGDILTHVLDSAYGQVAMWIYIDYEDQIKRCPAGKSIHHTYAGGLVTHILFMLRTARHICDEYGSICPINRALLYSSVVLHDIGKLIEFNLDENGLVKDYSTEGKLVGHPTLGSLLVQKKACELGYSADEMLALQHLILSHHGKSELGAAVEPSCIEAQILSYLDGLDSRIEIYRNTLKTIEPGEFSSHIRSLNKSVYRV